MKLLIKFLLGAISLFVVAYLIPGFEFNGYSSLFVAAVVIGIVNIIIRPILQIITLPISILTLGISAFLVNVSLLYIVSFIVPGFYINSFVTAIFASLVLSLVSWFLSKLASD